MVALDSKLAEVAAACGANGVKQLAVFGSAARGDGTSTSDIDFVVEFAEPVLPGICDRYLALHSRLEQIFGCEVDLVESSAVVNPVLAKAIESEKRVVYAA